MPLRPDIDPYYLSRPNGPAERAPGWYIGLTAGDPPYYLGANHVSAEIELTKMVELRKTASR
jgi:hypothetical protein